MTGDSGNGPHEILKNTLAQLNLEDRRTILADAVKVLPDQLQYRKKRVRNSARTLKNSSGIHRSVLF